MRLVVISHTDHYTNKSGQVAGWGPTLREIDFLSTMFDSVVHVAPFRESPMPKSSVPYSSSKVSFVALKHAGGPGLWNKLKILGSIAGNVRIILAEVRKADWVHVRLPAHQGLYVLPLLSFLPGKKRWFKYAGNWVQQDPPFSYAIQRWWLNRNWQRSLVTINGRWPSQPSHLLSFENPCFTEAERIESRRASAKKDFKAPKVLCFVGALNKGKGILQLVKSLALVTNTNRIEKLIIVGDGPLMEELIRLADASPVPVQFLGYLPRAAINPIYEQSHIVVLPSDSEGFPKVIAEGASYGCIPLVTNVSSIGQYVVDGETGFLFTDNTPESIARTIDRLLEQDSALEMIASNAIKMASRFTFERYIGRIRDEILCF